MHDAEVVLLDVVICHADGDRLLESDAPAVGTELHIADTNRNDSVLRLRSSGIEFLGGGRLALELRSRSGSGVLSDRHGRERVLLIVAAAGDEQHRNDRGSSKGRASSELHNDITSRA